MNDFYERVWRKCKKIPKGRVTTYREIAHALNTKAYRAVGTALRKNPYSPYVPCHRVVNSDGRVGKYSGKGGKKGKISMLRGEGIKIKDGKVDLRKCRFTFSS